MASQNLAMTAPSATERNSPAIREGVQISVRDQGSGMSPEEQASLFQPFRRGQARGTGGEKSTGLGLAIVKRIVTGHGGKIWLESDLGAGTTFFVVLPLQPPEEVL